MSEPGPCCSICKDLGSVVEKVHGQIVPIERESVGWPYTAIVKRCPVCSRWYQRLARAFAQRLCRWANDCTIRQFHAFRR